MTPSGAAERKKLQEVAAQQEGSRFLLSSGETIELPLHYPSGDAVGLYGVASAEKLNQLLAPEDLLPIEVRPGLGLAGLQATRVNDSPIGPYLELFTWIQVQRKPFQSGGANAHLAAFMWDFKVSSRLALSVGREIWGYPKVLAQMRFSEVTDGFAFELGNGAGETILIGRVTDEDPVFEPHEDVFNHITPYRVRRDESQLLLQRNAAMRDFGAGDAFVIGSPSDVPQGVVRSLWVHKDSDIGRHLAAIQFQPTQWEISPAWEALVLRWPVLSGP